MCGTTAAQMVVDGGNIYVLQDGRLCLYDLKGQPGHYYFELEASSQGPVTKP